MPKRIALLGIALIATPSNTRADLNLEVGYTLPYLSEIENRISYYGAYLSGSIVNPRGIGMTFEYNDLSTYLESYNYFIGVNKAFKLLGNSDAEIGIDFNSARWRVNADAYLDLTKRVGVHGGANHGDLFAKKGKLTDTTVGLFYSNSDHWTVGVDYLVGNASGHQGRRIKDRVNAYLRFEDW